MIDGGEIGAPPPVHLGADSDPLRGRDGGGGGGGHGMGVIQYYVFVTPPPPPVPEFGAQRGDGVRPNPHPQSLGRGWFSCRWTGETGGAARGCAGGASSRSGRGCANLCCSGCGVIPTAVENAFLRPHGVQQKKDAVGGIS